MARAASKTATASDGPTRRPVGRPPGSKNKIPGGEARKATAAPASKRSATKTAAPAPGKSDKSDPKSARRRMEELLEAMREKVGELELLASNAHELIDEIETIQEPVGETRRRSPGRPRKAS